MIDTTFLQGISTSSSGSLLTTLQQEEPKISFDSVLSHTLSEQPNLLDETVVSRDYPVELVQVDEKVQQLVEAEDLEEALNILDVEHDPSMLFIVLDEQLISLDEAMDMETIAQIVGMNVEELQQILASLTGQQLDENSDIWQVLQQSPQLLAQLTAVLAGESQVVSPKEANATISFLQIAQLLGRKVDLTGEQETTVLQTKQVLAQFAAQLTAASSTGMEQKVQLTPVLPMKPLVSSTEAQTQAQTTDTVQPIQSQSQQETRTVTVALPMQRSAQSEALVKEIQNQLNRAQIANNNGTIKLMLRLFPENLGQIRIEITQQDGVMQARILATSPAGKELLDQSLQQLKTALAGQNIQMDRLDVSLALQSSNTSKEDSLFQQFFNEQEQPEEEQQVEEEEVSFDEVLEQQLQFEEV